VLDLGIRTIPFTAESDIRLRTLKARMGLDRNYVCRMGFCLSLEEVGVPTMLGALKGAREIERYTLLGRNSRVYLALLLVWMKDHKDEAPSGCTFDDCFVAHMNRGVELMTARVRSLVDLISLTPGPRTFPGDIDVGR
jgi:DNA sulfur modification protein DndE